MYRFKKLAIVPVVCCLLFSAISMGTLQAKEQIIEGPQLATTWSPAVLAWSEEIILNAQKYGLDPDLVAAIVTSESDGYSDGVSYAGAVGLMGIMPQGPGFEYRPNAEDLLNPMINISWGCAILADIMQQSGGDLRAALAAYNGGWYYASFPIPKAYADKVMQDYAEAVVARTNAPRELAEKWTIGVEVQRGNIPPSELIVGNGEKGTLNSAEIKKFGEHLIYHGHDKTGRRHYVKGYAVPLIPNP